MALVVRVTTVMMSESDTIAQVQKKAISDYYFLLQRRTLSIAGFSALKSFPILESADVPEDKLRWHI